MTRTSAPVAPSGQAPAHFWFGPWSAACGVQHPVTLTSDKKLVTCEVCKRKMKS